MELYFTDTSPFARKVRVLAFETGLHDRLTMTFLRPTPVKADPRLSAMNPLNKIPALVLDDGTTLYDSPVICEYLDTLHGGRPMIPREGPLRWKTLRRQALCDGILDAGILVFYERAQRPSELHWAPWLDGQSTKARQGLAALEAEVDRFATEYVDLGVIAAAVTLGWLELRAPLGAIRAAYPRLFAWYDAFHARPSMRATEPQA